MLPSFVFPIRCPAAVRAAVIGCVAALVSSPLAAEWSVGAEGGTVVRDGGNATRLRLRLSNDERPLTHALYADWLNYSGGNGYRVGYIPRFWLDDALYVFGEAEARVDRPLLIDRGLLLLGGVGYRIVDTATSGLGVEIGAGARSTRFEAAIDGGEGLEESEGLALLRADAHQELADLLRLEFDAEVLQGETLGEIRAEAALSYRVAGGAVRLGYRVRRLSVDGGESLDDDDVTVGFTYGF